MDVAGVERNEIITDDVRLTWTWNSEWLSRQPGKLTGPLLLWSTVVLTWLPLVWVCSQRHHLDVNSATDHIPSELNVKIKEPHEKKNPDKVRLSRFRFNLHHSIELYTINPNKCTHNKVALLRFCA
jgi:hypothetical protein